LVDLPPFHDFLVVVNRWDRRSKVRDRVVIPVRGIMPFLRRLSTGISEPRQDTTPETPPKVVSAAGTITADRGVVDRRHSVVRG